ncbi:hypothetical protein [Flavobacterium arundinis]|uniref:hypothetical protein n=1 Tax=Flavobacterium arundinis TaxID=3139143 RepID=UPI0038B3F4E5
MHDVNIFVILSMSRQLRPMPSELPASVTSNDPKPDSGIRRLKPLEGRAPVSSTPIPDSKLVAGNIVMHEPFGKGEVLNLEGVGADKKAEIRFEVGGIKKLLLRFAKLDIIS